VKGNFLKNPVLESEMNEIVVIHVGQCGNTLAPNFWEIVSKRYGLDADGVYQGDNGRQIERINVFFSKNNRGFTPRAVFVDLEPGVLDSIRSGPYGYFFHPNSFVNTQCGAGNNWAKGHYTEGAELIDSALMAIRNQVDRCQDLQGFIVVHSIGGGVGAGMGTLIMSKLRDEYPNKIIATFSVFPSNKVSDLLVEPYNAMLTIQHLTKNADLVFCIDNEALYDICRNSLKITHPTYGDMNHLIASAFSGVTAPLCLPSQGSNGFGTLRDMVKNLVPADPRLHFLTIVLAPLMSRELEPSRTWTVQELTQQIFDTAHSLTGGDSSDDKSLAAVGIWQGQLSMEQVREQISHIVKSIPDNFSTIGFEFLPKSSNMAGTLISNNTSIYEVFKRINEQFETLFQSKRFLHWYTGEGMDEMEFEEAKANLNDLISEYESLSRH
jgi:tubulin beta